MAGTIPISMTQQFDEYGEPLSGGKLYIIQAGTVSTPQDAFQDLALTIKQPYPMTLDAAGRVPQFFLADGTVKIRLQDKHGVVQLAADSVLVIGPSSGGGGGGGTIDPTTIYQTGDIKPRYATPVNTHVGWVRCNGLTIGGAGSSATERINADCEALFLHLWINDPSLTVLPTRGASAAADWGGAKSIALPDYRGYVLGALDDMGAAAASGRISAMGAAATTLGGVGGSQTNVIALANLPAHTHSGTTGNDAPDHTHGYTAVQDAGNVSDVTPGAVRGNTVNTNYSTGGASTRHQHPFTTDGGFGLNATPFGIISPRKLCTFYIKL